MKKITRLISTLLVATLGVGALASCAIDSDAEESLKYVSLRINPEIEMLADEDGEIVAANAINEDGEVVLSTVELEGMSVEEAGVAFTEAAAELGYFDPSGEHDTVYISAEGATEAEGEALEEKLNKSIADYFKGNGINGKVSKETLDKYADKASEWGLSVGHTRLVMRALDANPELTDEEVLAMSVKDWLRLIKGEKGEEKIAAGLKAEYRADIDTLKTEYSRLFELRAEIEALEAELENTESEEAELEAIRAQIAEKEAELEPLNKEYKKKASDIKDEYKKASKAARDEYRKTAEAKKKKAA